MNKTLKLSFSLRNTYRVNSILFSLKQIPLLKRLLPATLYQIKGLKLFANLVSVLWEIVSAFLGKFLYFITMVCGIGILYQTLPENAVFLHILLLLTDACKLFLLHTERHCRLSALYHSVRYGQRRTPVVLFDPAPVHSGYEAVCGGSYSVGL